MPSRRSVCIDLTIEPAAAEEVEEPIHSVVPSGTPNELDKIASKKKGEITPTPPPKLQQNEQQNNKGGQLTLASFFTKNKKTTNKCSNNNAIISSLCLAAVAAQQVLVAATSVEGVSTAATQPKKETKIATAKRKPNSNLCLAAVADHKVSAAAASAEGVSTTATQPKKKAKVAAVKKKQKTDAIHIESLSPQEAKECPIVVTSSPTVSVPVSSNKKRKYIRYSKCQLQDLSHDTADGSSNSKEATFVIHAQKDALPTQKCHEPINGKVSTSGKAVLHIESKKNDQGEHETMEGITATPIVQDAPVVAIHEQNDRVGDLAAVTTALVDQNASVDREHYARLEKRYTERQLELVKRANEDLEANESLSPVSIDNDDDNIDDAEMFPNAVVGALAALVQGSRLPLSELSKHAHKEMAQLLMTTESLKKNTLTCVSVAEKIKLIAERKPHFVMWNSNNKKLDKLEDTTEQFIWRWELTSSDLLLTPESALQTKKARASRKKLAAHYKAISKLLELLGSDTKDIASVEERVLKFEREDEIKRLSEKKELLKKEVDEKLRVALSLKKKEVTKKEADKIQKLQERSQLKLQKEEEKKQKEGEKIKVRLEKERLELEQVSLAEETKKKQRALMAKFFVSEKPSKTSNNTAVAVSDPITISSSSSQPINSHNVDMFWKQLGSSVNSMKFHNSNRNASRLRRTKHIRVSVTVTVVPPFSGSFNNEDQCYSERRIISVPNKFKFLKFFEDFRPPYRGTWSKPKSSLISGRRPFGKDDSHLNYEIDSEAEWEEEEVEDGEDLDSVAKDDEEEDADEDPGIDSRNYNYADGWLAQDAKREQPNEDGSFSPRCVIAPLLDGIPITYYSPSLVDEEEKNECVLGMSFKDACDLLSEFKSILILPGGLDICMDPHNQTPEPVTKPKTDENVLKKEINAVELRTFCQFIHGCTLSSKEKIVEDFRKNFPDILCSRAELFRKLDSIGIKHRVPKGGTIWEVIQTTIDELSLKDVLKSLDLPKLSPETLVEASDTSAVKNEAEKIVGIGATEFSVIQLKTFCRFIHGCTLSSKEKIVDDFKKGFPYILCSRAELFRKLDSIVIKHRMPKGGTMWEVIQTTIDELSLKDWLKVRFFRKLDSIVIKHRIPKDGTIWEVIQTTLDELSLKDWLKSLDLPKPSPETLVEASDTSTVRNEAEKIVGIGGTTDSTQPNKSNRKHNTTLTPHGNGTDGALVTMQNPQKASQGAKKKRRIVPESLVSHASVALFASFLNKAKVPDPQALFPEMKKNERSSADI